MYINRLPNGVNSTVGLRVYLLMIAFGIDREIKAKEDHHTLQADLVTSEMGEGVLEFHPKKMQ